MYYIFPIREARRGRAAQGQSRGPSRNRGIAGSYRNRFWRKYGPAVNLVDPEEHQEPEDIARSPTSSHFFLLRQGARSRRAQRPHLAARADHQLSARARRQQIYVQHVGVPRGRLLRHARRSIAISASPTSGRQDIAATCRASAMPSRATSRRCSPIAGRGRRSSIDPASTGGPEWEEFLRHYNEFCSERRGVPLFNQTPFLTARAGAAAFGTRLQQFAAPSARRPTPGTACSTIISGSYCPSFRVKARISGNDTARGSERTVFRKPSTCGGKAIS